MKYSIIEGDSEETITLPAALSRLLGRAPEAEVTACDGEIRLRPATSADRINAEVSARLAAVEAFLRLAHPDVGFSETERDEWRSASESADGADAERVLKMFAADDLPA